MYVNLKIFLKAEGIALFRRRFRPWRWFLIFLFTALFWCIWCCLACGRLIDHIIFPRFRRQPVQGPVFIVAPPRSGTTYLQKLLSLDRERYQDLRLYHTIFPCVLIQRFFRAILRLDRLCRRPLLRLMGRVERQTFGGWDDIHPMAFNGAEEDEAFFTLTAVSDSIYLLFPYPEELWEAGFADQLPPRQRRRLMRFYRSCLQRHLYAHAPGKTVLTKNVQHCGRIDSLLEEFPDARVISILRHPYESVPSHISPFYRVWSSHSPEIAKDSPESRAYGRMAVAWYRHLFGDRERFDPAQHVLIQYDDLVNDPVGTVERIYEHFGFDIGAPFRVRLEQATQVARSFRSQHRYSLEEYGLTPEWVQGELGDILDAHSLGR